MHPSLADDAMQWHIQWFSHVLCAIQGNTVLEYRVTLSASETVQDLRVAVVLTMTSHTMSISCTNLMLGEIAGEMSTKIPRIPKVPRECVYNMGESMCISSYLCLTPI